MAGCFHKAGNRPHAGGTARWSRCRGGRAETDRSGGGRLPASGPRRALGGLWNAQTILGRVTPVRDLTDAAREGLNFQAHCTDLFHFDLPWNPGRIDRKLRPAPEAHCHYFVLHQRAEYRVLDVLVRRTETFKKELGSLSKVIDDDIERLHGNDIRHKDTNRLIIEIEEVDIDAEKKRITEEELAAARERREELGARIERCRSILDNSRQWIPFDAAPFRDELSCSLELQGAGPLVETTDGDGLRVWTFPPLDRRAETDPSCAATLDTLRAMRILSISR